MSGTSHVDGCAGMNSGNGKGVSNESKAAESLYRSIRDGGSVKYTGTNNSFIIKGNGYMDFTGADFNGGEKSGNMFRIYRKTVRTVARDQSPLKRKGEEFKERIAARDHLPRKRNETNALPVGVLQHLDIQEHSNAYDESYLENEYLVGDSSSYVVTQPARKRKHSSIQMENPIQESTSKAKAKPSMDKANRSSAKSGDISSCSITSAPYTIADCIRALDEIAGVSNDTYCKAVEKFKEVNNREIFLSMPDKRRKAWLETHK